jgi:hypothetical protein
VNAAQGQVAAANVIARQAQAAAQSAANVDRFRPAAPPKYGDKKKGEHVGQWIPVIEDYLQTALDADYIRLASSCLEGGPCPALRGYCRSSSGPAERSLHHGWSSPKFRLSDPCPLTCTPHAIRLLAMRNEWARRRRLNWPIYLKWC